jgi:UDP-glucose 4-epimerase
MLFGNAHSMTYFVAGGAGFIGSHLVQTICREEPDASIVVYDNFSSGRRWHVTNSEYQKQVQLVEAEISDLDSLRRAMEGCRHVYHFASNPDIARAATQPDIDFWQGTLLTQNVLEAMRTTGAEFLTYASGSGVYGDLGETPVREDHGPLLPTSTYAASKLAGEALACAYHAMFGIKAQAFRFANVVGPHQTHGVGYDFVLKLLRDPNSLLILGDGLQSKSYIHVQDVVNAMRMTARKGMNAYEYFNVATEDYITVREIADLVVERMGLKNVEYRFTGGARGWKGDVPIVRFDSRKIRTLGWRNERSSRQAMRDSIDSIIADARAGKFGTIS